MNKPVRDTESDVLRITRIGNSVGVILPKDMLARCKLKAGDLLHVIEQTERGIKLSPYDPKHAKTMKVARQVIDEYQDTFRALAK